MTQRNDKVTATVQVGGMINYTPCSVEVGEVTTLPAGSDATVTNSGNEYEAVFDFGIPQGAKGDTGETGATGKSAYESAVEQGYEGTEEEFATSLTTVDTKAAQAAASATAAANSATSASNSATSASNSATTATTKASEASASATAAAASATSAGSNATAAQNYVTQASTFASNAANSATNAASYASNAAASATNASAMASAASTSASSASASADTASAVLTDPDFVAVAGAVEDISTVATNIEDVNDVATAIADVSAVADDLTNIDAVNTNATNINTVATNISDVNATGQAIEDVSAVADNLSDITLVANDLENIDEVATKVAEWQKPADWVDIRSGAIQNSVYYLVGHSADYSTYNTFPIIAYLANTGTYDVHVDGQKIATANSGATTTLNFQNLALTTGYDVTYPTNLRTHVVRVTPTSASNTFTRIYSNPTYQGQPNNGVLWVHFEIDSRINLNCAFVRYTPLEAITAKDDTIKFFDSSSTGQGLGYMLRGATSAAPQGLLHLPVLEGSNSGYACYCYFAYESANLSNCVVRYKNCIIAPTSDNPNWVAKKVITDNAYIGLSSIMKGPSITELPTLYISGTYANFSQLQNLPNLKPTFLDMSGEKAIRVFRFKGTSSARIDGLKGLVLSNEAPFNDTGSPQLDVSYTGLDRNALVNLFNSMPTVSASQVCNITGATGAADLTAADLDIATNKGWTVTR